MDAQERSVTGGGGKDRDRLALAVTHDPSADCGLLADAAARVDLCRTAGTFSGQVQRRGRGESDAQPPAF